MKPASVLFFLLLRPPRVVFKSDGKGNWRVPFFFSWALTCQSYYCLFRGNMSFIFWLSKDGSLKKLITSINLGQNLCQKQEKEKQKQNRECKKKHRYVACIIKIIRRNNMMNTSQLTIWDQHSLDNKPWKKHYKPISIINTDF